MKISEKHRMLSGEWYNPSDTLLQAERRKAKELCYRFNQLHPDEKENAKEILRNLFEEIGDDLEILPQFYCDYGYNIKIGDRFFANHNLVILDCAPVEFGNRVLVGPNCSFYTAEHPLDSQKRASGIERAKSIKVGNDVWIGGSVTVLPGVTLGDHVIIGAGSVVTKDVPSYSVAVGNPCRVMKQLEKDKKLPFR